MLDKRVEVAKSFFVNFEPPVNNLIENVSSSTSHKITPSFRQNFCDIFLFNAQSFKDFSRMLTLLRRTYFKMKYDLKGHPRSY